MAGSRRSRPADPPVVAAVARALDAGVEPGARIAVALSGGRDSVALLAAACEARPGDVCAIHVHHGLSPRADAWEGFCGELAARLGVPLAVRHVRVQPGDRRGVEAAARATRYAALREAALALPVRAVLLAHHQDDQAETLLLQLGRGAGPHGLAAMAPATIDAGGLAWLRPLLDLPRAAIEAFVRERGLTHVDDESNASPVHRRNALRLHVVPAFAATFPGYPATLARAASHQAEAARLADDLAEIDSLPLRVGDGLDRNAFAGLPAHRARNVLRRFLHAHGLRAPSAARLEAMHVQLCTARDDARVELRHDGAAIGVHRGLVVVHAPPPRPFARRWLGEADLALPHGRLSFVPGEGEGIARSRLDGRDVVVRAREGGERLKLAADRPRRALKAWLQEAGVPAWERAALPLVFCDGELAAVAGLGVDVAFAAPHGAASLRLVWRPDR